MANDPCELIRKRLKQYEDKLGVSFFDDWDSQAFPYVRFLKDGSILTFNCDKDYFYGGASVGDIKAILAEVIRISTLMGCQYIRTWTPRNARAYGKLTNSSLVGHEYDEHGRLINIMERTVHG